jgi:hypothetical protein
MGWCCVELALVQPPSAAAAGPITPMTAEEGVAVEISARSDARVRVIVSEGRSRIITTGVEFDKAEVRCAVGDTLDRDKVLESGTPARCCPPSTSAVRGVRST